MSKEHFTDPYFTIDSSSPEYLLLEELGTTDTTERFGDIIQHTTTDTLKTDREYEGASLFTSYDIVNEVNFLKSLQHLPQERRKLYIESNIIGFVGEFAGKVPHKSIPGVLTADGKLEIAGFDMTQMMEDTADLAGERTREWYELQGMREVYRKLMDGDLDGNNRVAWVSPSKSRLAKYGMMMYFEVGDFDEALGGRRLTERIIRYDERYRNYTQSRRIFRSLNGLRDQTEVPPQSLRTDKDFLLNPIAFAGNAEIDAEILQSTFGYSKEQVEYVHHFEAAVQRELQPLINTYTTVALALSEGRYEDSESRHQYLEDLLGAIFNGARMIHEQLSYQKDQTAVYDGEVIQFGLTPEADDYRQQITLLRNARPLVLEDGSNCEVAYASVADIYLGLSEGMSIANILEKKTWKYEPGNCRNKDDGGCGRKNVLVGPCQLCKKCEKRIEQEDNIAGALMSVYA